MQDRWNFLKTGFYEGIIPEFDPSQELHASIAETGKTVADAAGKKLAELREQRGDRLSVRVVRRELRWADC